MIFVKKIFLKDIGTVAETLGSCPVFETDIHSLKCIFRVKRVCLDVY